jgi:3-hydroxyacyl-[acyl-carrier-protein] dehydratase
VNERVPGRAATATIRVPASAPFLGDHFPRRPVFPGTLLLDRLLGLALDVGREAAPGAALAPARVSDVKMRAFIAPGQVVELKVELERQGDGFGAGLVARVDGKTVATGRAAIEPGAPA